MTDLAPKPAWTSHLSPYLLLAVLFSVAVLYQARFSVEAVRDLVHPEERAETPFVLEPPGRMTVEGPAVRFVREEAGGSGLRRGDVLVAVEGKAYRGSSTLAVAVAARRPGDELQVRVRRGGQELDLNIRLVRDTGGPLQGAGGVAYNVWMGLVMPWFCLLVGFWVPLARPEDRRAWLLLALMLSFAHFVRSPDLVSWEDWLRPLAVGFHSLWNSTWPLWIFLFGLYFPEPFEWERRHRAVKWIVILPFAALAVVNAVSAEAISEDFHLAYPIERFFQPYRRAVWALNMVPISLFFLFIAFKWGTERKPDSRRRLKLLLAGTAISMTPMFGFVIHGLLQSRPPGPRMAPWFLFPTFAMLFLFPVTLAYVIVVQRAMDIRVVLRQSVQYALARRGLWALRAILGAVIIWIAVSLLTGRERLDTIETIALGSAAAAGVVATRHLSERAARWIDRRFFREAYNAEQILSELSEEVRSMVEERTVLETVARRVSESLHVSRVAILTRSDGHYAPAFAVGWERGPEVALPADSTTVEHLREARTPAEVYFDDTHSWINRLQDRERDSLGALGAQLLVPLAVKDRLLGFISLGEKRSEEPYSRTDLRLLESVAAQTALALENSHLSAAIANEMARRERLNRELEIAREVQERLFPQTLPEIAGLDYAGLCRPAQGVGGDYYDFLALPDGDLGIAVGDVSGKGVSAALLMASLQASLRSQAINGAADLAALMKNLNRLTYDATPPNRYATFFYAQYQASERKLTYVNAGHNAPMLFRAAGGVVERLETGGTVIGSFPSVRFEQGALTLEPGDLLVAFTDGVSEAQNSNDEEFGDERLVRTVERTRRLGAREMIGEIVAAVEAFAAGAPQFDDLTLVVLRVLPV